MSVNTFQLKAKDIISGSDSDSLRQLAKKDEKTTQFGSASYITKIRSRSAKFTEIIYEKPDLEQAKTIQSVYEYLKDKELICVKRSMCQNPQHKLQCHFYVTKDFARLAYMWHNTLFEPEASKPPDIILIDIPEWTERKVLVDAFNRITYVLGTDYTGEVKKGFLRMAMYIAKKRGSLGLHAGSKLIKTKDINGQFVTKGAIFFGLSGTGKTTLTCHHHNLTGEEKVTIRQDDVVLIQPDTFCVGTEDNFYIKTEGLEPKGQPGLYKAAISPKAILENIYVDENGKVDFLNYTLTSNGRCVVFRSDIVFTDNNIDLPRADIVIFITRRNDITPPVAKLTPSQGAAFFILGESIETSAGDPTQAGKSLRVVGTNPFIVGPEYEEGNRFFEILKNNPSVECFVMNTGRVGGKKGADITISDSTEIIKQIVRGSIKWKKDLDWGYQIPEYVEGVDIEKFSPLRFYSEESYNSLVKKLKSERKEWLAKFPQLDEDIINSLNLR